MKKRKINTIISSYLCLQELNPQLNEVKQKKKGKRWSYHALKVRGPLMIYEQTLHLYDKPPHSWLMNKHCIFMTNQWTQIDTTIDLDITSYVYLVHLIYTHGLNCFLIHMQFALPWKWQPQIHLFWSSLKASQVQVEVWEWDPQLSFTRFTSPLLN